MKKFLYIAMIFILLNSSYAANVIQKPILGQIEKIKFVDSGVILDAKIDTGAAQSSLSAQSIKFFNKKNQPWVSFLVPLKNNRLNMSAPIFQFSHILKRQENSISNRRKFELRPVILLTICVANKRQTIKINLTNRSQFRYPMLLGKDVIKKLNAYVDVTKEYVTTPDCK